MYTFLNLMVTFELILDAAKRCKYGAPSNSLLSRNCSSKESLPIIAPFRGVHFLNLMRVKMIHSFVSNSFSETVIYFQEQLLFKYLL